jgi:hypothetical protein
MGVFMRYLIYFMCILFTLSCGVDSKPVIPKIQSEKLALELARIKPLLPVSEGMAAFPGRNNITKELTGDVGDSMCFNGFSMLYGRVGKMSDVYKSVTEAGRPYRHPSYVDKDTNNSFSRDQYIGLMEASVASGDKSLLRKVWNYYKKTGKICPDGDACNMTTSLLLLSKQVLGDSFNKVEESSDEWVLQTEASSVPVGYQLGLVSRKLMLKAMTNNLTKAYGLAAKTAKNRAPRNLWFRTMNFVSNNGDDSDFVNIGNNLLVCLQSWKAPGKDWAFNHGNVQCWDNAVGWEYYSLGAFLLKLQRDPSGFLLY